MKKSTLSWPTPKEFSEWYATRCGEKLRGLQQQHLDKALEKVFGYYAVSLGPVFPLSLKNSAISTKIEASPYLNFSSRAGLIVDLENLPFANQSIDLCVLAHVLEFSSEPKKILQEVMRSLMHEGSILIFGFNIQSFFGLWRWLQGDSSKFPWRGNFVSAKTCRQLLEDIGFDVSVYHTFYFRPPFQHKGALQKIKFLEVLGPLLWPQSGASYMILAHKKTASLTPTRPLKENISLSVKEFAAAHRERLE